MIIFRHVILQQVTTDVTYDLFRLTGILIDSRANFVAVLCGVFCGQAALLLFSHLLNAVCNAV